MRLKSGLHAASAVAFFVAAFEPTLAKRNKDPCDDLQDATPISLTVTTVRANDTLSQAELDKYGSIFMKTYNSLADDKCSGAVDEDRQITEVNVTAVSSVFEAEDSCGNLTINLNVLSQLSCLNCTGLFDPALQVTDNGKPQKNKPSNIKSKRRHRRKHTRHEKRKSNKHKPEGKHKENGRPRLLKSDGSHNRHTSRCELCPDFLEEDFLLDLEDAVNSAVVDGTLTEICGTDGEGVEAQIIPDCDPLVSDFFVFFVTTELETECPVNDTGLVEDIELIVQTIIDAFNAQFNDCDICDVTFQRLLSVISIEYVELPDLRQRELFHGRRLGSSRLNVGLGGGRRGGRDDGNRRRLRGVEDEDWRFLQDDEDPTCVPNLDLPQCFCPSGAQIGSVTEEEINSAIQAALEELVTGDEFECVDEVDEVLTSDEPICEEGQVILQLDFEFARPDLPFDWQAFFVSNEQPVFPGFIPYMDRDAMPASDSLSQCLDLNNTCIEFNANNFIKDGEDNSNATITLDGKVVSTTTFFSSQMLEFGNCAVTIPTVPPETSAPSVEASSSPSPSRGPTSSPSSSPSPSWSPTSSPSAVCDQCTTLSDCKETPSTCGGCPFCVNACSTDCSTFEECQSSDCNGLGCANCCSFFECFEQNCETDDECENCASCE